MKQLTGVFYLHHRFDGKEAGMCFAVAHMHALEL
jgi:hypothetical protein